MNYKVKIKEIPSIRIAYTKYHGKVQDANKVFPKVFKSIKGKTNGAPFFNYLSLDKKTKIANLELALPTFENPNSNDILIKNLPSQKVLSTIHKGPYENIVNGYKAIHKYALEENIKISPPFKEIFIKGPGIILKGNPDKYITEIQFTIVED